MRFISYTQCLVFNGEMLMIDMAWFPTMYPNVFDLAATSTLHENLMQMYLASTPF